MEDLLLPRIAAGDQSAVPECISRYGPLIWSLARRRLASRQDAEDAVQDVFVDLWRSADRFDPLVSEEITFVAMIARRRVIDTLRRRTGLPQACAVEASSIAEVADPAGDASVGRRLELGTGRGSGRTGAAAPDRLPVAFPVRRARRAHSPRRGGASAAALLCWQWSEPRRIEAPPADGLGDVVWSPKRQQGFMRFRGLAANDPSVAQYQLWIFDAERNAAHPVDGGVFDVPAAADGEVVVRIDPRLPIRRATAFAITVEQPGGVVVSSRDRLPLIAALP